MARLLLAFVASCATAPVAIVPKNSVAPRTTGPEHALTFSEHCYGLDADGLALDVDGDSLTIVTCPEPNSQDKDVWHMTAFLVRRSRPAWGTQLELETWEQTRESGGDTSVVGAIRDADHRARRVFLRHAEGGLDNPGVPEVRTYEVGTDTLGSESWQGDSVDVVVAPDERSATVTTCKVTTMRDQTKTCAEHAGSIVKTIVVR